MKEDIGNGGPRKLRLRYPGTCATCGIALSKGAEAFWHREQKQVTCLACAPGGAPPSPGNPGASAAAEGERRRDKRVEDVRRRHGDHAAAVAAEMAGRDAAATWGKGSGGEAKLASYIAEELGDAVIALHDRLIPGTRGNIDHVFVASTGVWVVDAKTYKGKLEKREVGPIWGRENRVYVAGRDRSDRAAALEKQVAAVIAALRPDPTLKGTDVHAALCFLETEWDMLAFPFQVGSVWVLYRGALRKRLRKRGSVSREAMERIARRLDLSLPPV